MAMELGWHHRGVQLHCSTSGRPLQNRAVVTPYVYAHVKGSSRHTINVIRCNASRLPAGAHSLSAVGSPKAVANTSDDEYAEGSNDNDSQTVLKAKFRFWYDERRFKGVAERSIVQQALFEAGGVRTGGYPKAAPVPGPLGSDRMDDWDMLWSPGRSALGAAPKLRTGQLLPCVPGLASITRKAKLVPTLKAAYGSAAFSIIPESYTLPTERDDWAQVLVQPDEGDEKLWILKTGQHLGKGLKLLPGKQALKASMARRKPDAKPFVVAQRYVDNPLLINGCKFGIRVWVLVTSTRPYRAYLHQNGLVLFSTQRYDSSSWETPEGAMTEGHVTNYAMNVNGSVWDLDMLRGHLGGDAYQQMWDRIVDSCALTFSAALPTVLEEGGKLKLRGNSTFEVLGVDFLIDNNLHPWLLEVNATPSLAVEHEDPQVESLIYSQKMGMVRDMVNILDLPNRFAARYQRKGAVMTNEERLWRYKVLHGRGPDGDFTPYVREELARAGGWMPLMTRFPYDGEQTRGWKLGWGVEDLQLKKWMEREGVVGA